MVSRNSGLMTSFSSGYKSTDRAGLPWSKCDLHFLQHRNEALCFLVATRPGGFGVLDELLFHRGQIGQRQFGVDGLDIGDRIDLSRDVHDIGVFETAHHMGDGVGLANVGQELVAQSFAFGRSGHQPGDIHELDDRRNDFLRLDDLGQLLQARIGHFHDADVGLDGAEGIVLRRDARLGQRVEEGGFAHIGQSDDAAFETH